MNELEIKINQTPIEIALGIDAEGKTTARKLYTFLELAKGQFSRWAKTNILENEFAEEGVDYWGFDINVEGNITQDFKLTASFAKKLSMTQKNEKGEQARNYFVIVENKTKELVSTIKELSPELQAIFLQDKKIQTIEKRIQNLEETKTVDYGQQLVLKKAVNKAVMKWLNGKSPAYKAIGKKVFSECNKDIQEYFKINSRNNMLKIKLEEALIYIENWQPCNNTQLEIQYYNSLQTAIAEECC